MKIVSIFGTRPEMIKMCATLKKLDALNFEHVMVHTGQNYTKELKDFFFKDLNLRKPDYQLNISTKSYSLGVSDVIIESEKIFKKEKPDALLILGDTYSGLSVLPASNMGIKIFHMEAGLRAWDKRMPEQRNRILIDHISDVLLPYNTYHRENLIKEGIHPSKIIISGNTTFETMDVFQNIIKKSKILKKLKLRKKEFILYTAHRSENVDNEDNLKIILESIIDVKKYLNIEVVYPIHPRTYGKKIINSYKDKIRFIQPLGFFDFNYLLKNSYAVVSDSGTAAEEGLYYGVPNITLRGATERYETLESGMTIISGLDKNNILESIKLATSRKKNISRYDFYRDYSPSDVVINALRSKIKNYF